MRAPIVVGVAVVAVAGLAALIGREPEQVRVSRGQAGRAGATITVGKDLDGQITVLVDAGTAKEGFEYYDRIAAASELNWPIRQATCDKLLIEYIQYSKLDCSALETRTPTDLMQAHPNDVEVVRFFSPKISTVGAGTAPTEFGWRKLIRLRTPTPSLARTAGISSVFVLFNFLQAPGDIGKDAFASRSVNTQVFLVREKASALRYWGYWVLYDPAGKLTTFLKATFEGGEDAAKGKEFHVPNACIDCHGSDERSVYLAFLDVDHWVERTQPGEEFTAVSQPLPDLSGSIATSDVMDRFRRLNTEISSQNASAGAPSHVAQAAASWVTKHPAGTGLLPMLERGFVTNAAHVAWSSTQPTDRELLPLLNRYCYRCHGTKAYNVYEREFVRANRSLLRGYVSAGIMPQDRDRKMVPNDKTKLLALLQKLP